MIAAAGVKPQLQQGVAATAFHHLVVGHGQLAAIIRRGGEHTILAIGKPRCDGSLGRAYPTPRHRHIGAVVYNSFPVRLELLRHLFRLRHHHQARSIAVETVDDVGVTMLVGKVQILVQHRDNRHVAGVFAIRQQPLVLIHHQQMGILVHNIQFPWFVTFPVPHFLYRNAHAGQQLEIELTVPPPIHKYIMRQNFLHLRAAAVRHLLHQEFE